MLLTSNGKLNGEKRPTGPKCRKTTWKNFQIICCSMKLIHSRLNDEIVAFFFLLTVVFSRRTITRHMSLEKSGKPKYGGTANVFLLRLIFLRCRYAFSLDFSSTCCCYKLPVSNGPCYKRELNGLTKHRYTMTNLYFNFP